MSNSDLSIKRQLDAVCNDFEEHWTSDVRPDFELFLERVDTRHGEDLLKQLLEVDVELRIGVGQEIDPDEYKALGTEAVEHVRTALKQRTLSLETAELAATKRIGPFKLLQQIGEGGMGTVWMADQEKPVKRRVALKVIKAGVGSKEIITRFEAERQALALMNHSNIARILDVGTTDDGQPYFAMELVLGPPLTTYCDNKRLGISERLSLFTEVCSGVQHAHQKGIIHRDLKPSNILVANVDGRPVPKVIDFGLAKALESTQRLTDQSMYTGIGQILGTLKYMSPEQASLDLIDIDTRTDIYSLGVVLYELLTGSTPLDNDTVSGEPVLKVLELIRDKEPVRPSSRLSTHKATLSSITKLRRTDSSSLNRILVGDLDWVVIKALEKNRSRRYESASGLAADIQRFLHNEPVTARPPSAVYRIRKFVRKNRAGVAVALLLVTALLAGLAGTTWQMRRAQDAERRAERAKELAQFNEQAARQQSQLALSTLTSVIGDIQDGLQNLSGSGEIRRQLLKTSLAKLESVATKFVTQAAVDINTVKALNEMGQVILQFGVGSSDKRKSKKSKPELNEVQQSAFALAMSLHTRAFEIAEKLVANDPTSASSQHALVHSMHSLGDVRLRAGQVQDARDIYEQSLETGKRLAVAHPNDAKAQRAISVSHIGIGDVQSRSGHITGAMESYEQGLDIRRRLAAADPNDTRTQRDLSIAHVALGDVQYQSGKLAPALESFQQGLQFFQKLVDANPSDTLARGDLSITYTKIGNAQFESGLLTEAQASYQQGLEIRQSLADADPNDSRVQRDLATSHISLGNVQLQSELTDKALQSYQRGMEIRMQLAKTDPSDARAQRDLAIAYVSIGMVQRQSGQTADALNSYQQGMEVFQKLAAADLSDAQAQRDLSVAYTRLGNIQQAIGQMTEALGSYQKDLEISQRLAAADPNDALARFDVYISHHKVGSVQQQQKLYADAIESYGHGLRILRKLKDEKRLPRANEMYIGVLEQSIQQCRLAPQALGDWKTLMELPPDQLPILLEMRGVELTQQSRFAEATEAVAKLCELKNVNPGQLYNAACVFSLCAASIQPTDGAELTDEQTAQRQGWIRDGRDALKRSLDAGWNNFQHLQTDPDITLLRAQAEFSSLIPPEGKIK